MDLKQLRQERKKLIKAIKQLSASDIQAKGKPVTTNDLAGDVIETTAWYPKGGSDAKLTFRDGVHAREVLAFAPEGVLADWACEQYVAYEELAFDDLLSLHDWLARRAARLKG